MCFSPVCSTIHLHTILLLKSHFEYQVCCCHSLKMILTPLAEKVDTFCKVVSPRSKGVTVCGSKPSVHVQKFTKKNQKTLSWEIQVPQPWHFNCSWLVCYPTRTLFVSTAGFQDTSWFWSNAQRRNRQKGHQVQAPGGGVHIRALAGPDLQGQEAGK